MHQYTATVAWTRKGAKFTDNKFSRAHEWRFDGGAVLPGSSSPLSVPVPYSDSAAVDPEEALVAALSSCHMLFFLAYAARKGWVIESYTDEAVGTMDKNDSGKLAITHVRLRPHIIFAGAAPSQEEIDAVHHRSHEECYIANSLKAHVDIESA
ncbi:MAG: OsmC family protein [Burkholderiales bacterium]